MNFNTIINREYLLAAIIATGALLLGAIIFYFLWKRRHAAHDESESDYLKQEFDFISFPIPCCLINEKGYIFEVNQSWLDALKFKRNQIVNKRLIDILVPGYQNQFKLFLAQFESNPSPDKLMTELRRGDGLITTCQLKGKATYIRKGVIHQIALALENFDELGRLNPEASNIDNKFRLLFEKATDAILLIDDGVYMDCNEAALKLLGFEDKKSLIGQRPASYAPEYQPNGQLSSEFEKEVIQLAIDNGGHHFEWTRFNAAGEQIIVEVSLTIIPYQGKNIIVNMLRDITDRKRIEEQLRSSEEKYRILIENANEAIFVAQDEIIKFSNNKTAELFGYELSELIDKNFSDYIHPDDREIFAYRHRKRQDGLGLTSNYKLRVICRDGNIKWFDISAIKINWDGKPASLIFASDITARRNIEKELRESRKMIRTVLDNIPVRVFWKDTNLKYLGCNRAFAEDTGLNSIAEVIGKSDSDLSWKNNAEQYHADDQIIIESGVPKFDYEEPLTMPDGRNTVIRINKVPLMSATGQVVGILGSYQDVTEEKRAREALAESEKQLANVIDFLPDATFVIDKNEVVIAWNRAMEKLSGVAARDIIGKGDYEYAVPFYGKKRPILINLALMPSEELTKNYSSIMRQDEMICAEAHIGQRGGRDVYLWGVATPLRNSHGNIVGSIESIRDITERKKSEMLSKSRAKFLSGLLGLTDATEVGALAFEYVSSAVPCNGGRLVFQEGYNQNPRYISIYNFNIEEDGKRHYDLRRDQVTPTSDSALGQALLTGKPVIAPDHGDAQKNDSLKPKAEIKPQDAPNLSEAYIPLKMHGEVVGVFGIWSNLKDAYSKERVQILENIAADLALALTAARTTEALRENEKKIQTIANTAQDAIIMTDTDGNITFWNRAAEQIFGYTSAQVMGKDVHQLLAIPDDLKAIKHSMGKRQYTDNVQISRKSFESEAISKSGEKIPIELSLAPVKMNDKWHAVATIRNITERKLAEKALRDSEEKYRRLIETAPVTIWSIDFESSDLILVSPAVEKLVGYTPAELMENRKRRYDFMPPETITQASHFIKKLKQTKAPVSFESKLLHRDGTIKSVSVLLSPGFDNSGEIVRVDGVTIDMTEKKLLEDQVIQSEKMAAIGVLAAGVAHEFNNLLCGIVGNLSLVQNNSNDNELSKKGLGDAIKAADQATELVQSLLSYSGRKGSDIMGEANLAQILKDIVRLTNKELKNKNIHLITNYNDTPPIYGSPNQLQQVFLNILINAIHAVAENGIISISIWHDIENAYVEISDNGIGIGKEHIGKIFDPFYSTKGVWGPQKARGTGLGLSISNNIIENHGGKIHVKSIEGIGTEFTVILPINIGYSGSEAPKSKGHGFKQATIIEFNRSYSTEITEILMNQGISCEIMQWGEELIAKGKAFNSDLVILDAGHPGLMDFARTIDYIKENFPGVAILLSSAGPVRHEFEEYIDEADGIIYKPYNRESVLNALARVSSAHAIKGGTADVGA